MKIVERGVHWRQIDRDGNIYEDGVKIGWQPPCHEHDVVPGNIACRRCHQNNARALVDEVIHERELDLINDHSAALEFVRELAGVPCEWGCSGHPEERPCLRCRAATWLNGSL